MAQARMMASKKSARRRIATPANDRLDAMHAKVEQARQKLAIVRKNLGMSVLGLFAPAGGEEKLKKAETALRTARDALEREARAGEAARNAEHRALVERAEGLR